MLPWWMKHLVESVKLFRRWHVGGDIQPRLVWIDITRLICIRVVDIKRHVE